MGEGTTHQIGRKKIYKEVAFAFEADAPFKSYFRDNKNFLLRSPLHKMKGTCNEKYETGSARHVPFHFSSSSLLLFIFLSLLLPPLP